MKYIFNLIILLFISSCTPKEQSIVISNESGKTVKEIIIKPKKGESIEIKSLKNEQKEILKGSLDISNSLGFSVTFEGGEVIQSKSPSSDTVQDSYEFTILESGKVYTIGSKN